MAAALEEAKLTIKRSNFWKHGSETEKLLFTFAVEMQLTQKNVPLLKFSIFENVLANYPEINPVATAMFGGRMKMLGKTLYDNLDLSKVESWAEKLGKIFSA